MSSSHVTAVRPNSLGARGVTCHVVGRIPSTSRGNEVLTEPDPAHRVGAAGALLRLARWEIAQAGRPSPATAEAFHRAVRSLSYAELRALIAGLDGPAT